MPLSRHEVEHIARLARVGLSEPDIEKFREQLSNILENFQVLQKVDTSQVPPTGHAIAMQNVMRPDKVAPSLPAAEVLANAPQVEADSFRVRAVLEF